MPLSRCPMIRSTKTRVPSMIGRPLLIPGSCTTPAETLHMPCRTRCSFFSFTTFSTRGHQEESKEIDQSINTYTLLYKQGDVHCRFIPRTAHIPVKAFFGRRRK